MPSPLMVVLSALAVSLSLGCDAEPGPDHDELAEAVAAVERSPSQDLVELEEPEGIAFDALDLRSDNPEHQTEGAGCTLLRPVAWSRPGVTCVEYYKAPGAPADTEPMFDGQSFITYAGLVGPGLGQGSARVHCEDGAIRIETLSCVRGGLLE